MKRKSIKIIAYILLMCLAFGSGMLFQKYCFDKGITEESEDEPEIIKEIIHLEKKKDKKEKEVPLVVDVVPTKEEEQIEEVQLNEDILKEEPDEINLPEEIEEQQRDLLPIHIPQVKSLLNSSNLSIQNMPDKKQYYKGNNGTIESIVERKSNNHFHEYLISYDYKGNKVDQLEIGIVDENIQKKKYAVLFQNNISTFEVSADTKEEIVTTYQITPDLRFTKGKTYKKVL